MKQLAPEPKPHHFAWLLLFLNLVSYSLLAQDQQLASAEQLKHLSLEELMNVDVTSVSRRAEPLFSSPSAIQVITQEDIARSGASSIPEALRLAPNLQVAQVDSRQWAISSRGFNNGLANKLLVMIDGRTIYTPLFAGVFWDVQDLMLEDLDRIEVISGPGGTLWGANAVNGVINIITKNAKDTQGTLISGGGGTFLEDFAAARYGTHVGEDVFFRVYGKYFDRGAALLPNGDDATNAWRLGQGGFRLDWLPPNEQNTLTLEANGYGGSFEQPAPGNTSVDGQNVLGRWTRFLSLESELSLQLYWDRTWRHAPTFAEELNTWDLDFQHRFPWGERQILVWGGGYRLMADRVQNTPNLAFIPPDRNLQLFSGFIQDEVALVPERLQLTIGSKLEHNDYSGFEVQPSVRLAWTPNDWHTVWAAISRAVRSPSRIDTDLRFPANPPFQILGNPDFDSEKLLAYELGYRVRPWQFLSLSLAGFFNDYDQIRSLDTNTFVLGNANTATEYGVEWATEIQPASWWRLRGGYTFLEKSVELKSGASDLNAGRAEGNDPEQQAVLQSMFDLPARCQLGFTLRYVDRLPSPPVPAYFTFDARFAWSPRPGLELSIVGQNLSDEQHPEFGAPATRLEIPRSVYGKISWSF